MTWRVGLVGVGGFAQQAYLPALRSLNDVEVTLLCGRSRDRIESVKHDWSLNARVEEGPDGLAKALDEDAADAVVVVVPDRFHAEMVQPVLAAGRHVLCEKPITTDAASARLLRDLASATSVVSMMSFTYRYTLALQQARQLIEDGAIGEVAAVRVELHWGGGGPLGWREDGQVSPGGIWFDGGSHMVDTVGVLVGGMRATRVFTSTVTRADGARPTNPDVVAVAAEVERGSHWFKLAHRTSGREPDAAVAISGLLSRLDRITGDQVIVVGSEGALNFSLGRGQVEWLDLWRIGGERQRLLTVQGDDYAPGTPPPAVARMVQAWRDSLDRRALSDWDAGFDVGCAVQEVLSAQISESGRPTST